MLGESCLVRRDRVVGEGGERQVESRRPRVWLMKIVLVMAVGIMVVRLIELQVVQGEELRLRGDNNRIFQRSVMAPRGIVTQSRSAPGGPFRRGGGDRCHGNDLGARHALSGEASRKRNVVRPGGAAWL